jgi:uncharacterized peroxidase-related enzyme
MVDYALKLTRTPGAVKAEDVDTLRTAGFDDSGILDICQVAAYYNYVNRLADGLGVELEEGWVEDDLTITRSELEQKCSTT